VARIGIDVRITAYAGAGIAQYVRNLVAGLGELAVPEELVLLSHRRARHDHSRWPFWTRWLWTPAHNRWEQWSLPLELLPAGLDLLHSPDVVPPFRRRWRSVITIHDLAFMRFPDALTRDSLDYYRQVERAVEEADAIIAVSRHTASDIIKLLGVEAARVHIVLNAVHPDFTVVDDTERLTATRARYELPQRFGLFVGTVEPRKNLAVLIEAWRRLSERGVRIPLVLAGAAGWKSQPLYEFAERLRPAVDIRFLGRVGRVELVDLYNLAWVHVHPAIYEGFGLTALEAMACGTPTIVSDVASLPEVVGEAGLRLPPGNPAAWADGVQRILGDADLRTELRRRGLERAAQFSRPRMAGQTLAVYRSVLDSSPALTPAGGTLG
jgi:glycosyltransferase involved in cell wall biosynthesis